MQYLKANSRHFKLLDTIFYNEFQLILLEDTAFGVVLRHASLKAEAM